MTEVSEGAPGSMNETRTCTDGDTELARSCSRDVLRAGLIAMRAAHGATSTVGRHCSNIVELIQMPELPPYLLKRQMAGLQRALAAGE